MKSVILDYIRTDCIEGHITTEITETTPLLSSGLVDSLNLMNLIWFLERTFKVSIPLHMASRQTFDTVNCMVEIIEELQRSPYIDEVNGL